MAINLQNASLISISTENIFLGDGIFNYKAIDTISLRGLIDSRSNSDYIGVAQTLSDIATKVASAGDYWDNDLIINGVNFGNGRVTSLSFDRENPVRIGEYSIEIEIFRTGNLDNLAGTYYTGVKSALTSSNHHLIEDLTETFDFNINEDGSYNYAHNISVDYLSGANNPINDAKNLAGALFSTTPQFGFIDGQFAGFYNAQGKKTYSEEYDLVNYSFSFSKEFSLLSSQVGDYTSRTSRTLDFDQDGNTVVSEKGEVQGMTQPFIEYAALGVATEIASSFSRCNAFFNKFVVFADGNYNSLNSTSTTIGKEIDTAGGKISYDVSYTNNPRINASGYIHEYTLNFDHDTSNAETKVSENGSVRPFGNKSLTFDGTSAYSSATAGSFTRVDAFYQDIWTARGAHVESVNYHPLTLTNTSIEYPKFGASISYTKNYSSSTDLRSVGNLRKVEISISDTAPIPIKGNFFIPSHKEIVQDSYQTEMGSRNVRISAIKNRTNPNYFDNPPDLTNDLNTLKSLGLSEMRKIPSQHPNLIIKDIFITDADYSFSSEGALTLNMSISFVGLRGATDIDAKL